MGANDDGSDKCEVFALIQDYNSLPFAGGIFSALSYLYLFYMYFVVKTPIFKRHPTNLVIYKCLFEFLFVQQYIWLSFVPASTWYESDHTTALNCIGSRSSQIASFFTQFSFLGAELAFFFISFDLRVAYTNPFSSFKTNRSKYFTIVTVLSLISATLLVTLQNRHNNNLYGESIEGVIWIRPFFKSNGQNGITSIEKLLFFYIWVLLIFIYSVWALWSLSKKLKMGYYKTLSARLSIMTRAQTFVSYYSLYWFVILVIQLINYEVFRKRDNEDFDNENFKILSTTVVALLSWRGLIMLIILIATNYDEDFSLAALSPFQSKEFRNDMIANAIQEGVLTNPNLNRALRAEVLYFTAQGIIFAAREARKHMDRPLLMGNSENPNIISGGMNKSRALQGLDAPLVRNRLTNSSEDDQEFYVKDSIYMSSTDPSTVSAQDRHRDTFHQIAKIEEHQASLILKENSHIKAIEREAKDLGYLEDLQELRPSFQAKQSQISDLVHVVKGSNTSVGVEMRSSIGNKEDSSANPLHNSTRYVSGTTEDRSSIVNNRISAIDRSSITAPGIQALKGKATSSDLNLADDRASSASSVDTTVTEKWRETMDINYSIMPGAMPDSMESTRISHESSNLEFKSSTPHLSSLKSGHHQQQPISRSQSTGSSNPIPNPNLPADSNNGADNRSSIVSNISQKISSILKETKEVFQSALNNASYNKNKYDGFTFKDFCPVLFARLRAMSGISEDQYTRAFEDSRNLELSFSEGRSGAFFFYSLSRQFLVKSTTEEEINTLIKILHNYSKHLAVNRHSLLNRFLGAHCITMYGQKIYFVVNKNVFGDNKISERYDFKGSWVNRHSVTKYKTNFRNERSARKDGGARGGSSSESSPLFLDNDIQQKITLPLSNTMKLADQIHKDVAFLRQEGLMDYSLIVGIKEQRFEVVKKASSSPSQDSPSGDSAADNSDAPESPDCPVKVDNTSSNTNANANTNIDVNAIINANKNKSGRQFPRSFSDSYSTNSSRSRDRSRANPSFVNSELDTDSKYGARSLSRDSNVSRMSNMSSELKANPFLQDEEGGIYAGIVNGSGFFYMGIIDILGEWTWTKRLERFFKVFFLRKDGNGISALQPDKYATRFVDRCVMGLFDGLESYNVELPSMKKIKNNGVDRGSLMRPSYSRPSFGGPIRRSTITNRYSNGDLYNNDGDDGDKYGTGRGSSVVDDGDDGDGDVESGYNSMVSSFHPSISSTQSISTTHSNKNSMYTYPADDAPLSIASIGSNSNPSRRRSGGPAALQNQN